jgi:hypothetical protein
MHDDNNMKNKHAKKRGLNKKKKIIKLNTQTISVFKMFLIIKAINNYKSKILVFSCTSRGY